MIHLPPCVPRPESVARILQAALDAADPRLAVRRALRLQGDCLIAGGRRYALANRRIRVAGVGKAAAGMARGLADVLGERLADGVLIVKHLEEPAGLPAGLLRLQGSHPVPDGRSLAAAQALADYLRESAPQDLLVCLVSGGGSALMTLPVEGVTLEDLQALTRLLLGCGAEIGEMNTLRRRLDRVKGGGLARLANGAEVLTLILSDVVGSPLEAVASGPTVAGAQEPGAALHILQKYGLQGQVPAGVLRALAAPAELASSAAFDGRVHNLLAADNALAARAALRQARREGFHALLLTTFLQGEARQVGRALAALLRQAALSGEPARRPACLIAGGETTVTLQGGGRGGRNQELALGALEDLAGLKDAALITLATDGEDGSTPACGAAVDGSSLQRARSLGLRPADYLRENDSYTFFAALGDLLVSGPSGTNVNDLAFLVTG